MDLLKFPNDILYKIFDDLWNPWLYQLRQTSSGLLRVIDDYVLHRCETEKHQNTAMSKVFTLLADAIELVVHKNKRLMSIFLIKVVWRDSEDFDSYSVLRTIRNKVWGILIVRVDNDPVETWRALKPKYLQIEETVQLHNQYISYHNLVFNVLCTLLSDEFATGDVVSDELGIISFEKEYESAKDLPHDIFIILTQFENIKHNDRNCKVARRLNYKAKFKMKLTRPPINPNTNTRMLRSAERQINFYYKIELHAGPEIRTVEYKPSFKTTEEGFETFRFNLLTY